MNDENEKVRLTDDQIRQFICNGVLVLDSQVALATHERIFEKIEWNNDHEFNMGNNVLPRIPELQTVLDSPVVSGALASVLGDEYVLHPHRFMHASQPLAPEERELDLSGSENGPAMGQRSSGSSYWHQDSQSPLSRARYHVPRLAMILYFPQDTPVARGPTRVIPGTHLQARLEESNYAHAFVPDQIKAGTCLLIAFDIGHAGLSNMTDMSRYMFKFVFMRTRNPTAPSWIGGEDTWQTPRDRRGPYDHESAWRYIWDWMRAASEPTREGASDDIGSKIGLFNAHEQGRRLDAIYDVAAVGEPAIPQVVASLLQHAGRNREFSLRYRKDEQGRFVPEGDPNERRWNEGAFALQDEAYCLGAMGPVAIDALVALTTHEDAWICINAAFALGEIGKAAARAIPSLTALLDHERHQVVRAALDAIACIGCNVDLALPAIRRILTTDNQAWQKVITRGWTGQNQVRFNALCVLLNSDLTMADMEPLLLDCLGDDNGYVPALALELLTRPLISPTGDQLSQEGLSATIDFLKRHRFDDTLAAEQRVF
ncbi:MAG: phytanoyl-CoA dioxygenase family protein [Pseudomonadota bacterium]